MESTNYIKGVTRNFLLRLNPDNCRLTVNGIIIPDNSIWACIPKTNHNWLIGLPSWEPAHHESSIIEEIKKDMVFNPEGASTPLHNYTNTLSLARYLNSKNCDINFILDANKKVAGKLSNGERIALDTVAQDRIMANGIGKLSDYIVLNTIYNDRVISSIIKLNDNTTPILRS